MTCENCTGIAVARRLTPPTSLPHAEAHALALGLELDIECCSPGDALLICGDNAPILRCAAGAGR
eukprot:8257144-Prorocentrum_lima.AAC.1